MDSKSPTVDCILGLDLATKCGWNLWTPDVEIGGVWDLTPGRLDSVGMRLINFRSNLNAIKNKHPEILDSGLVVWEEVNFVKYRLAYAIHEQLVGVLTTWCYDNDVNYTTCSVPEIKKYASGKGNASKKDMIAAAKTTRPLRKFADDNEVDAFWITETIKYKLGIS